MDFEFSTTGYLGSSENKSYTVYEFEHISNQASDALTSACENFGKSSDFQNYALCQANLGRLLRVKSRCRISENEFELSVEEEGDLRSSIAHYQRAVDIVANKIELSVLYEALVWDLMSVKIQLSTLYQDSPPLSRYSRKEIEKKIIDLFESTDKIGNQIIKMIENNQRFYLRLGELNQKIAAMHHGHIVESDIENKQLNYSVRRSHKYYLKCISYFECVDWTTQSNDWIILYLRATIELAALIKNFNPEKSKCKLEDSLKCFIPVIPILRKLHDSKPRLTSPIIETAKKVMLQALLELNKSKSSFSKKKEILETALRTTDSIEALLKTVLMLKLSFSA